MTKEEAAKVWPDQESDTPYQLAYKKQQRLILEAEAELVEGESVEIKVGSLAGARFMILEQ